MFGLSGSRQQKFLVLRFFDVNEQQGIDRFISQGYKNKQGSENKSKICRGCKVSNDDIVVAQRRLEDKQHEEKTNTVCLRSIQKCMKSEVAKHLGDVGIKQQNGFVDETNVTLFAKSGEYKKTFIGFGVGTGSMQVLHGFEFKVEPLGDHTFEMEPQENIDQGAGLQEVQT
uniref:Uncharacterized protein n=1 Tax=Tanacetum cinerariifolium TaxID=118510 RepID=A0A699L9R2_TANCI|nr:hypothetical protein [Tanacetum cinerariifolium]